MNEHVTGRERPATYQDVLDAPPHMVAELIQGALHLHPRPAPRHAYAATKLGAELDPFNFGPGGAGPGGWTIVLEPELHLGGSVLVPDLAGWRNERLPRLPEAAWFDASPDWVCEVLSPSTRRFDLGVKRAVYGRYEVRFLWHVDPEARTLEAFELRGDLWQLIATLDGSAVAPVAPFAERPFHLGKLWRDAE